MNKTVGANLKVLYAVALNTDSDYVELVASAPDKQDYYIIKHIRRDDKHQVYQFALWPVDDRPY